MPERDVVPAQPGWFAVYRFEDGSMMGYPVVAWERTDDDPNEYMAVVVGPNIVYRRDLLDDEETGRFIGYQHDDLMTKPGWLREYRSDAH